MAEATNQGTAVPMGFSGVDEDAEIERAEIYGLLARLWLSPPDAELLQQFAVAVTQAPVQGAFLEEPWQALVHAPCTGACVTALPNCCSNSASGGLSHRRASKP